MFYTLMIVYPNLSVAMATINSSACLMGTNAATGENADTETARATTSPLLPLACSIQRFDWSCYKLF